MTESGRTTWIRLIFPGDYTVRTETGSRVSKMTALRLSSIAANTNRALETWSASMPSGETAFGFPVLVEHASEGKRLGTIREVKFGDIDGKGAALWAKAEWTPTAWKMIEQEDIQHVSLGTEPDYTDEQGNQFGECLVEFSVVGHPLIKSIGRIQDTMSLRASKQTSAVERFSSTPITASTDMTEDQMKALIAALSAALNEAMAPVRLALDALNKAAMEPAATPQDAVDDALAALDAEPEEAPPEEDMSEDGEVDEEKEEMSARIKRLESAFVKLATRSQGLNFSERGSQGKSGAAKVAGTPEQKVKALVAQGKSGHELFAAYYK